MTDVVPIFKFKKGGESMQQIKSICHFINKYEKINYYFLSLQLVGLEPGSLRSQTFYFNNKILKFNGNYF